MANIVHQAPPGGTSTPVDYITMQEALSTAAALAAASTTTVPSSSLQQQARIPPAPIAPIAARSAQVLLANNNNNTMLPTVTPCTTQQAFPYVSYATQPSQLLIFPAPGPFDQLKLRRGKWTSEEEAYAELLIVEFEKGTVEGCENGCTLRSFLSKKLHCAPMRISKKYAGMCVYCILLRIHCTDSRPILTQHNPYQENRLESTCFYPERLLQMGLASQTGTSRSYNSWKRVFTSRCFENPRLVH